MCYELFAQLYLLPCRQVCPLQPLLRKKYILKAFTKTYYKNPRFDASEFLLGALKVRCCSSTDQSQPVGRIFDSPALKDS